MKVIRIVQNALGFASDVDGAYVREFLPDTDELGRGTLLCTSDPYKARKFPSFTEAWEFWRQQSKRCPLRPDSKPNRPLTAYTVEFLEAE